MGEERVHPGFLILIGYDAGWTPREPVMLRELKLKLDEEVRLQAGFVAKAARHHGRRGRPPLGI